MPRASTPNEIARQLRAYLPTFALPQLERLLTMIAAGAPAACPPVDALGESMDYCALCGAWKRPGAQCPHFTSGKP